MVHRRKVAVVTDSSACLPQTLLDHWQIRVVPHEIIVGNRSYRDGVDMGAADFYRLLQGDQPVPTTSSPPPAAFLETFRAAGAEAEAVLCVTLCASFSTTYDSAVTAAGIAMGEPPGTMVRVVDSMSAAGAEGLMALEAAKMAEEGACLDDVTALVEGLIPRMNLLAFLDTMSYLWRSGRVPKAAAWAGSLLGIKPLTELKLGQAKLLGRPRSRAKALEKMLAIAKSRTMGLPVHMNVMHAQAEEDAEDVGRRVDREFDCRELLVSEFTPVMGAHLGPGLLGLAFYTDPD